jgi:hypothetical protein
MRKRKTDSAFNTALTVVRAFFVAQATVLGLNMKWFADVFMPLLTAWVTAFDICNDPAKRTHAAIKAKDDSRAALEPEYSRMVKMLQDHPDVTDAQLVALEIPRRKPSGGKPLPPPPRAPLIELSTPERGVVEIHVRNAENNKHGKPPGAKVCILSYVVLPASAPAPVKQDELTQRLVISTGKGTMNYPREMRTHVVYASGQWANARGDTGPHSDISSIGIS